MTGTHERADPVEQLTIPGRFTGPPRSANGGYVSGAVAGLLSTGDAVEVTLRQPPPVDRPLQIDRQPDRVRLYDGETLLAEAVPANLQVQLPAGVTPAEAASAAEHFDTRTYARAHPFPGCFTCGPARPHEDGLRLFPAAVPGRDRLVAWPWTPAASLTGDDGLVDMPVMWAALDCPSGLSRFADTGLSDADVPAVLGRMTTVVHRRPTPGELVVSSGWVIDDRGRKLSAGAALWSEDGDALAVSESIWITLSDDQLAAFHVSAGTSPDSQDRP